MRIAIIGSGISGLVVAHLLHRQHDITVFESADYAGGHANTIRVDTPYETHHVDTGFIVFNDRNYPNFERLLHRLGVAWQPSTMSFSVSDGMGDFEYSGGSPNGLFANRRHLLTPWFHRMVSDLARFNRAARRLLAASGPGAEPGPSLGDWLERHNFSRPFIDRLIVPQASAVWSADPGQIWSFPARFMAEFFDNHGMLGFRGRPQWRVIRGGSARYVEALTAPFTDRMRLRTPVRAVRREEDGVLVWPRGAEAVRYDEVVLATHSDQALALLQDATDPERQVLGAIPYQVNEAVLHTDRRLLPRRQSAWASWNYHWQPDPSPRATVTYHMNRLQAPRAESEFCVTLNRTGVIDPERVIRKITYDHPVYTARGVEAQRRFEEVSGRRRTHFCGAYWGWGFHEDGVRSALRVAERFGRGCECGFRQLGCGHRFRQLAVGAPADSSAVGTPFVSSAVGTASCIYEGTIRHRRRDPSRSFEHRIALFYVDLDELPRLLAGRLVARRPGTLRFRRRDYLGPDWLPLDLSVRDKVQLATGTRPSGPIRLLTQLRSFGHCFNPVSFYYCFDRAGDRVDALLAEVTNTPWGERYAYVLGAPDEPGGVLTGEFAKALHVSPFMDMDHRYVVRAATPGERLAVHIESRRRASPAFEATAALPPPAFEATAAPRTPALRLPAFEATLALRRTELTQQAAARVTRRYPLASARVLGLIYGHALGLKLAGATVYPHPGRLAPPPIDRSAGAVIDRVCRALLALFLRRITTGSLTVVEAGGRRVYGSEAPIATITIQSAATWRMALRGSRGLADAYAAGLWDSPDLTALVRLAARNAAGLDRLRARLAPVRVPVQRVRAWLRRSTPVRRRRDIAAHYDLGNQLFSRMLDPTMSYSCALFEPPGMTLEEAQLAKLEVVCQKLDLGPGDRVLEIGTGWGGLAIHAASTRGCHVTTTTISRAQYEYATAAVRRAGLEHRVTVLLEDYRDLTGRYDKLVSIEMIEAVGWRHFGTFLAKCSELLTPQGSMLLQAITIDDRAYDVEKASRSFMNTRIFPGGCLPSVEVLTRATARRTDLQVVDLEDLTGHYVETLRRWRRQFARHAAELAGLGYDEPFRRLWMLYLSYCEAGFAERRICLVQLLLGKPRWCADAPAAVLAAPTAAAV